MLVQKLAGDALVERNYHKEALTRAEVEGIVRAAGSVAAVLNTRHATAKAGGWKDAPPSRAAFVAAALEEPNLLRRPVTVRGGRAVVGGSEKEIRALFA